MGAELIFLKQENVLFIKPIKVAGTSFEISLSQYAQAGDIITPISENDEDIRQSLGFRGPQNYLKKISDYSLRDAYQAVRSKRRLISFFNHMSATELRQRLGAERFDRAAKISIVRNPFDTLVSVYYYVTSTLNERPDFAEWALQNPRYIARNLDHYFVDGEFILDHVIRYEALLEDCLEIEAKIPGLQGLSASMRKINAKGHFRPKGRDLSAYFADNEELVSEIKDKNREIIDRFGYTL